MQQQQQKINEYKEKKTHPHTYTSKTKKNAIFNDNKN